MTKIRLNTISALFISLSLMMTGIMCAKSNSSPVRAVSLSGCSDTSGVYTPLYSGLINVTGVAPGSLSHFIRVCNEVTVTGVFTMNGAPINPLGVSFVTLSLPIPLSGSTTVPEPGLCMVFQSGVKYPINGQVLTNGNGTIQIKWNPSGLSGSSITYHFVYTVN